MFEILGAVGTFVLAIIFTYVIGSQPRSRDNQKEY